MFSLGQTSLYASLNLPQPLAKLLLGPIDGNRSSSGRSPLELSICTLRAFLLASDPKNRFPGEPSTFPALFPIVSSPEHCHTPPARPGPDHLA